MAEIFWRYDSRNYCTKLVVWAEDEDEQQNLMNWIGIRKSEEPKNRGDRRHTFLYSRKIREFDRTYLVKSSMWSYFVLYFKDESEAVAFKIQWQS